jgi:hypothetical protein
MMLTHQASAGRRRALQLLASSRHGGSEELLGLGPWLPLLLAGRARPLRAGGGGGRGGVGGAGHYRNFFYGLHHVKRTD